MPKVATCVTCGKWTGSSGRHCRRCSLLIIRGLICEKCGMYYDRKPVTPRVPYSNHCVWCEEDGGMFRIANVIEAAGHWVTVGSMLGEPEAA